MIRVLFVDHAEALGGAEHSLLLLLRHLDRQRFRPILACNEGALAEAARALDVRVEIVPMPRLRGELAAAASLARGVLALARCIRRASVDVIQCNAMRASLYAGPAAKLARRPLVWHVRDVYQAGLYLRWMALLSKIAIATSQATAAPLPGALPVQIIPNGVDLAAFDPEAGGGEAFRRNVGIPQSVQLVGILGRLRPFKGQRDFIRAMALVAADDPEAHFVVVGGTIFGGDEGYEAELLALAQSLGIAARLHFAGQRDDPGTVLSALDILVQCSTEPEGFGRVVIEGMAARLPVVAYAHGGPTEIVLPGETGYLVPVGDIRALAEAVSALLKDPARSRKMGLAGRRRVEQRYDVQPLTRRIEEVLAQAAAGHGGNE